jgi:ribosome-binding factor A
MSTARVCARRPALRALALKSRRLWEIIVVSKRIRDRRDSLPEIDAEFAAALEDEDAQRRQARSRHAEYKTRQLCHQVQRALNLALAARAAGEDLDAVFVSGVAPAPDCGRLLVQVVMPDSCSTTEVLSELRARTPRLRAEVARSISRKRAPELSFVPGTAEDERDG